MTDLVHQMVNTREMRDALKAYVVAGDEHRFANLPPGVVSINVSHSNLKARMIELKLDLHMTIGQVKEKLHKHTGTPSGYMNLTLMDGGHPIAELGDDTKMLGFYSVESGMGLHITDTDPYSMSRGGGLEDVSQIQKYRISDEDYDARKNTVREWIREQKRKDPNWKPPQPRMVSNPWVKQEPLPEGGAAEEEVQEVGPETVEGIEEGMRCEVAPGARRGEVAFVGEVSGLRGGGHWVGVRFDEPQNMTGDGTVRKRCDGTVKGERIFECEPMYGGFIRGRNVTVGDFPAEDLDMSDEDEI